MPNAVEALQRQWARDDQRRAQRRKAKREEKKDDGGLLGGIKSFVSDVTPELGIGNAFDMLTAIPAGIGYIGSALGPGGVPIREGVGTVGKGLLHSFQNTGATIAKPFGGDLWYEPGVDALNKAVLKEDVPRPQDFFERARDKDQGLIPAIIEDVGNVAIVGAPAARALKLGNTGTLAAPKALEKIAEAGGASGRLIRQQAKWGVRAAKVEGKIGDAARKAATAAGKTPEEVARAGQEAVTAAKATPEVASRAQAIQAAEAAAHPYETAFRNTVARSAAAAQAATKINAARTGARLAEEAGEIGEQVPYLGPEGTIENISEARLEAEIAEAQARSGRASEPRPVPEIIEPEGLNRLERQMVPRSGKIMGPDGEPIEPVYAKTGPAEAAAIRRKAVPPSQRLLEKHLARLEGDTPGARVTRFLDEQVQGRLDAKTLKWVNREGERFVEAARRAERNAPWYQAAVTAASENLVNVVDPATGARISAAQADDLIGAEIMSRLTGIEVLNRAAKEAVGEGWSAEALVEFEKAIGAKRHVIDERLMTPELDAQLEEIANLYRDRSQARVGTLLGDRLGAKGLQSMNDDAPTMTKTQRKEYSRIKRVAHHQATVQQRKIVKARTAIYKQIEELQRRIDDEGRDIEKLNEEADRLEQVADGLLSYTPPQLRDGVRQGFWDEVVAETLRNGEGVTANPQAVSRSTMFGGTKGWQVAMLPGTVKRVRLAEFGADVLEEAYQGHRNFLTDTDAKIGTWVHVLDESQITQADINAGLRVGDQVVDVDFSQETLAGAPLSRWQAKVLGEARAQAEVRGPNGESMPLNMSDESQALASVFRHLVRDPNSQFNRTMRSLYEVPFKLLKQKGISAEDVHILVSDIDAMMEVGMAQAVYASRAAGEGLDGLDKFFGTWRAAVNYDPQRVLKGHPNALLQVMLNDKATLATFERARQTFPQHEHLASWYYRSHDFVESTFRPMGDVRLLDGTTINMADLVYQLLAVTSIQSTPLSNLGNALSSIRNLKVALSRTDKDMQRIIKVTEAWRKSGSDDVGDLMEMLYPQGASTATPEVRAIGYRPREVDEVIDRRAAELEAQGLDPEAARVEAGKVAPGYGTGIYASGEATKAVYMILSGKHLDTWDSSMAETVNSLFGGNAKSLSTKNITPATMRQARADLEAVGKPTTPEAILDRATMLHHGTAAWAKLRSFYENLSNPAASRAVTLDDWMARLFGVVGWGNGGAYAEVSAKIAKMADDLNMQPHEVQALLWAYAKHHVVRGEVGRLAAGAWDGFAAMRKDPAFRFGTETDPLMRLLQEDLDLSTFDRDFRAQVKAAKAMSDAAHGQAVDFWRTVGKPLFGAKKPNKVSPWADFDHPLMEAAGRAYMEGADASNDPVMIASYDALVNEIRAQYRYLTETLGIDVRYVTPEEEYQVASGATDLDTTLQHMAADMIENKRLKVRSTTAAGEIPPGPLAAIDPETGIMFNDMFRAVHDAFGHAHANNFSRQGEQVAFRAHAQLFTPAAMKALASELLGQNSALILNGEFPPQKIVNMPDEIIADSLKETVTAPKKRAATRTTRVAEVGIDEHGNYDYSEATRTQPKIRTEKQEWIAGSDKKAMARSKNTYSEYRKAVKEANAHLVAGDQEAAREAILSFVRDRTRSVRNESPAAFDDADNARIRQGMDDLSDIDSETLVERLNAGGHDGDTLLQSLAGEIRGALVRETNKSVNYTLRVFPGADFTTLMHEGAHVLRKMLSPEDQAHIEGWLGVKFNSSSAAAWRAAEEKFADAFMNYLLTGRAPARSVQQAFDRTKSVISDSWEAWRDTDAATMELPDEMYAFFDNVLGPEVRAVPEEFNQFVPSQSDGLLRRIYETPVHPNETATAAKVRTYKATRAADDARVKRMKLAEAQNRIARLRQKQEKMAQVLRDHETPIEVETARRNRALNKAVERLGRALQNPATGQVPAKWQPMWDAYKRLLREAETNPGLEMPDEWIDQFAGVLELAARNGFDPQHVRSFTPKQVEGLMYGQMRLGADFRPVGAEVAAGTRTARTRPHAVAQSVSALAAAMVEVVHESQTNHLVDFIEQNMAARVVGGFIPDGWVAWDPVRRFITTGERIAQGGRVVETIGAQPTRMIPKAVADTIRNMGRDYTHWAFKALAKVQDPWRALVLTMTPRWYVNNFVGNFLLSTAAGVNLTDWMRAWHEYRQREFSGRDLSEIGGSELARGALRDVRQLRSGRKAQPFGDIPGVTGASIYSDLADPNSLLMPKGFKDKWDYIRGTRDRNRVTTAYKLGIAKLSRANEVVDEMARAAVYFSATRKGASPEFALMRAYEALVDYGDLSQIERQMVRAVIPFYSWQKGILKLVVKAGIEHPASGAVILQLDRIADEWFQDTYGTELPSGYAGLIPFGDGAIQTRGMNPFADAGALVTAQGIARSMNPFAESIVRSELGAPEGGIVKEQRVNEYGRLVPEVNVPSDLSTNVGGALPQVQLGQRLTGNSPSPYPEPLTRSVGRYFGAPFMGGPEVERLVTRTSESRATLGGPRKPAKKRRKKKSALDTLLARLKKSSNA